MHFNHRSFIHSHRRISSIPASTAFAQAARPVRTSPVLSQRELQSVILEILG